MATGPKESTQAEEMTRMGKRTARHKVAFLTGVTGQVLHLNYQKKLWWWHNKMQCLISSVTFV